MWKTWDQTLGQEDPLEKEMATHSSTLAWKKDGTDEPICRAAMETQTERTDLWTQRGKERMGLIDRLELKHICYRM